MSSLNRAEVIGNLGQDPDIRYTQSGTCIANLSVATSEKWNDKNTGDKQEKTEWHKVAVFGKLAEIIGQYCTKGSKLYLSGRLQTRKWQDKEGNDRWTTEIVLSGYDSKMVMLGGGQNNGQNQASRPQSASPSAVAGQMGGGATSQWFPQDQGDQVTPEEFDSDIPF